ncbi:MAG: RidA family protein [Acidobacteria bacterium]|nr:RidA family protein [Acidobacteriota bacterium]
MIDNPKGNFQFAKGSGPYSSGAVAHDGYEVVHVIFNPLPKLWDAFGIIERHMKSLGRPLHALCGMELRIPKALSIEAFNEFNEPYIERLKGWGTHVDGMNPVARTNVATAVSPVPEPSVYGFSYTIPSDHKGKTFVIAGAGELRSSKLEGSEIVSRGDTSTEGLRAKAKQVLSIMDRRLEVMGLTHAHITQSNVYTVFDIAELMELTIMPALGEAGRHGIRWHFARPPVLEIDFEMDMRGVRQEITLAG